MSIIWKYLDKRSAAVDALKDYSNMKFIIEHTDDEIKAAYEKMGGVSSPQSDGMPRTHNPRAAEDRMIKGIEEIDVLKERYRQAVEYMADRFRIEQSSAYNKKNRALHHLTILLFGKS